MPIRGCDRTASSSWLCALVVAQAALAGCSGSAKVDRIGPGGSDGGAAANDVGRPLDGGGAVADLRPPDEARTDPPPASDARQDLAQDLPQDLPVPDVRPPEAPSSDGRPTAAITLQDLQVGGTHNSYHLAPSVAFHASHKYSHKPLPEQLAAGLRAIELDVHLRSDGVLEVYHITVIDPRSTCNTFEDCLRAVANWSAATPRHTPLFIWIEIKDDTGGSPIDDPQKLEDTILRVFPRDHLITPSSLRGMYKSPRERVMTAGWPLVDDVRGKVMFSVLNRDERARVYTHDFTSLDDRLMFVSATADQFQMPWAVVTEASVDDQPAIARAHAARLLMTTNVCAIDHSDDDCRQRLATSLTSGIHMLKDDLPFTTDGRSYILQLPKGSPGCNPVTAPPNCATTKLE